MSKNSSNNNNIRKMSNITDRLTNQFLRIYQEQLILLIKINDIQTMLWYINLSVSSNDNIRYYR